ncbi:alpha-L-fucosidase [Parasphaerochaeta coccoides]|uniref:alpha-L-fucosidase n=1 Tax=Parasphaerochaeta coccoides (strain ATCC BAA-1237 / DSM 17374 / SPN1) TaxID=760011 RepID=F4GHQ6_PARC1|nr:alpha-L-fucosidase [Parasphaerochaeta coccoides]AEC01594.1 glycoside hydrolase family 29 (alpha-L-fucosidase) [Parasphaerochaeta coccoides DSM 17374]
MKKEWYSQQRLAAIQKWKDLAYGMFVHFGLYSLCGGVWDGENVKVGYSEQILSHGPVPQDSYEALKHSFSIENFDADAIASLAVAAGMRYIVLTAKHHDGFCLFDTATTDYSTMHSPCRKDIVAEMSRACSTHGLGFGLYYSWIDWHFPYALPISPHNSDAIPLEHMDYTMAQLTELLTGYGEICELWMDMGAPTRDQSRHVADLAHSLQPNIMVNGRVWNDCGDFLTMGDNQFPEHELQMPWQTPATIYHETWGYRSWQERKDAQGKVFQLSSALFSVLDGGGNYLLNIGPTGDGSIVPFEREVLEGIGREVRKRGLSRNPQGTVIAERIEKNETVHELGGATKQYRYTGGDYYSFHPIVTALSWKIELERDAVYEVAYRLSAHLEKEMKLCLDWEHDGGASDDDSDGTFIFTLKRGHQESIIFTNMVMRAGITTLTLHTVGSPIKRPELEGEDIILLLRKQRKE